MKASTLTIAEKVVSISRKFIGKLFPNLNSPLCLDASYNEIEEYREKALQKILKKASKTEFYSSKLKEPKVKDIKDLEYLITTDKDLRKYRKQMRNPSCHFYFTQTTSGTGGSPLKVDISIKQLLNVYPIHKRCINAFGISSHDKGLVILHRGSPSYYLALFSALISDTEIEFADYRNLEEQLLKIRGKDYIIRYSTPLLRLAQSPGIEKVKENIKAIIYTAEPLSSEGEKILKETFPEAQIRSIYGAIETYGPIGFTCKNGKFHLNPDFCILEEGKNNNAIVTCLDEDRGTILIRYIGLKDKVQFTNCSCNLKFPSFELEGTFRHIDGQRIANAIYISEAFKKNIIGPYFDWELEVNPKEGKKIIKITLEKIKNEGLSKVGEELKNIIIYGGNGLSPSKPLQDLSDMLEFEFNFLELKEINKIKAIGLRKGFDVNY